MTSRLRRLLAVPLLIATLAIVPTGGEQQSAQPALSATDTMIAMRDGQRLYTQVYAPKAASGPLPILLLRTPYGTGDLNAARIAGSMPELTTEGFIIAVQDIRGRFRSEGNFVMLRQPRESKDAKSHRRGHRYLRHHRMAPRQRARSQWTGRHRGHQLRRVARGHGACSTRIRL